VLIASSTHIVLPSGVHRSIMFTVRVSSEAYSYTQRLRFISYCRVACTGQTGSQFESRQRHIRTHSVFGLFLTAVWRAQVKHDHGSSLSGGIIVHRAYASHTANVGELGRRCESSWMQIRAQNVSE
jgi:hypothetical protein